jgi:hypothetical protein
MSVSSGFRLGTSQWRENVKGPDGLFAGNFLPFSHNLPRAVELGLKKQGFLESGVEKCLYCSVSCFISLHAARGVTFSALRGSGQTGLKAFS